MKIVQSIFLDFENQYGIGQGVVNKMLDELKGKGTAHGEGAYAAGPLGDKKVNQNCTSHFLTLHSIVFSNTFFVLPPPLFFFHTTEPVRIH